MSKKLTEKEWVAARALKGIEWKDQEIADLLGCSRSQINHGLNDGKKEPSLMEKIWVAAEDPRAKDYVVMKEKSKYPIQDKIVEALKIMRENGKKSFTTGDLHKIIPGVSISNFSHYLTGRHGEPPIWQIVPFNVIGKSKNRIVYSFVNGQTILPNTVTFDARTDHEILMDVARTVEVIKQKMGMSS